MVDEGTFYPIKSMKAEERLWWYSRFFDCVEVNSTFYAPLSAQNAVLWVKRTPPGFLFSVKAYALLTGHHLDGGRLPEPLAGMLPAAAKADARGRLDNAVFPARGPRLGVRHVPRGAAAARRRGQARLCPVPDGAVVPPWPRGARLSRDPSRAAARDHRRRRISRRLVAAGSHRRGAALPGRARAHLCLGGHAAHPGQRVERPRADVAGRRDPAPRAQRAGLHEAAPRAGADGGREVRVSL